MPSIIQHLKEINKIKHEERIKRMELYCIINRSRFWGTYYALMIVLIHMGVFGLTNPVQYVFLISTLLLMSMSGYWWYDCEQSYTKIVKNTDH